MGEYDDVDDWNAGPWPDGGRSQANQNAEAQQERRELFWTRLLGSARIERNRRRLREHPVRTAIVSGLEYGLFMAVVASLLSWASLVSLSLSGKTFLFALGYFGVFMGLLVGILAILARREGRRSN